MSQNWISSLRWSFWPSTTSTRAKSNFKRNAVHVTPTLYSALLYFYSILLCSALLYSTLLYSTLLYSTLLCSSLLYSTLLYSTLLYSTLLYSALLYSTLLYSALLCSTLLYSTMLCSTRSQLFFSTSKNYLISQV